MHDPMFFLHKSTGKSLQRIAQSAFPSLLLLAWLPLLLGCGQEATPPPPPSPGVTVVPVVEAQVMPIYELIGRSVAVDEVDLRARVQGYLEQRNFQEGSQVAQGDLLYVIEKEPYQADVDRAAASLAQARATLVKTQQDLERLRPLHRKGVINDADFDTAVSAKAASEAQVKEAEASLRSAQLNLDYTHIYAPIAGRIGRSAISVGNLVTPASGVLASIVKLDPIYVTFTVSERDVMTVRQEALARGGEIPEYIPRIRLSNGSLYPHQGRIEFIDNQVDQTTGTVTLRAEFPNPDRLLLPGQFVTVLVEREKSSTERLVPQASVQQDQSGYFVLVVDAENRVNTRRIVVGDQHGSDWIVKEGLETGELVVFEGLQKVRPGVEVQTTVVKPPTPVAG